MIKTIKIQHDEIYPEGMWVNITHEKNQPLVDDETIYYYVGDEFVFEEIKVGEIISLDEDFKVLEVE